MTLVIILSLILMNFTPVEANNDLLYQVLEHVNAERRALGRPVLRMDGALSAAAQTRAYEIEGKFSHTRPNGSEWYSIFDQHGITAGYIGENLAKKSFNNGQANDHVSAEFFRLWKNSPGHYENMIKAEHTVIGMAVHKSGNVYHMVQLFNSEAKAPEPAKPKPKPKPAEQESVKDESRKPQAPPSSQEKPSATRESDKIANVETNNSDQRTIQDQLTKERLDFDAQAKEIEKLQNKVDELIKVGTAQDQLIEKQVETIENKTEENEALKEALSALKVKQKQERRIFIGSVIVLFLIFIIVALKTNLKSVKDKKTLS